MVFTRPLTISMKPSEMNVTMDHAGSTGSEAILVGECLDKPYSRFGSRRTVLVFTSNPNIVSPNIPEGVNCVICKIPEFHAGCKIRL